MTTTTRSRRTIGVVVLLAGGLLTACGAPAAHGGSVGGTAPPTEPPDVVYANVYCVVSEVSDEGDPGQLFEDVCAYEGHQPNPYPRAILRERVVDEDGSFVSTGGDGSIRTGKCVGVWDQSARESETDAGVLPHTPGALTGSQLCTFSGSFVGGGEYAGLELVEEGGMYRSGETTFRGFVEVRAAA